MIKKLGIFLIFGLVLCVIGGGIAYKNKYYVKKFIKSNGILYTTAKKAASIKHEVSEVFQSTKTNIPAKIDRSEKQHWTLSFDASKSLGKFDRFWANLGYESFKNGILTGVNRRLFNFIQESNKRTNGAFRYIRAHNLYSNGRAPWGEGCDIYREDEKGRPQYNWEISDQVFDRIVQAGLKPIVEFGFMPDALASIPERRQKWGRGNISPPKDYKKWEELVYQTVRHFRKRYGDAEISTWFFEVWNEPDLGYLFWIEDPDPKIKPFGDIDEYHKLYDFTVQGAKRAFPGIRIGGPASAGGRISQLLEHVELEENFATGEEGTRIDFISSHAYGKIGGVDSRKGDGTVVGKILWKVGRAVKHDHPKVRESARQLPFLLTETGPSTRKGEYYNSRYVAAWLVKMVDAVFFIGDEYGPHYKPDQFVFWTSNQNVKNFDKEKGIATYVRVAGKIELLKRPAYNAYDALGYLGDERIEQTNQHQFGDLVHALATKKEDKSVQILVYHLRDHDQINEIQGRVQVEIDISNLPFEQFWVQWYMIDETHSNSYTLWKKMGSPKNITRQQFRKISAHDDLELYKNVWQEQSAERSFRHSFELQNNSVSLFVLTASKTGGKLARGTGTH